MTGKPWRIVADIGGTNARFGLVDSSTWQLVMSKHYSVADHNLFSQALVHFLSDVERATGWQPLPESACFALACPITGGRVKFTNSPWVVDREHTSRVLNGAQVLLINDFEAVGYAVTQLSEDDWIVANAGTARPDKPIAVLGPGTGLGVCTVVPVGDSYQVLAGEGGHVDFAPVDALDIRVLEKLSQAFGRVSIERVLSGSGIENIYRALEDDAPGTCLEAADISAAAVAGSDPRAQAALALFCRTLGSVAGNLALTLGAGGGVYIAGGIVPRFIDFFLASGFIERFFAKGRFETYLSDIPVRVVVKPDLGLAGAINRLKLDAN